MTEIWFYHLERRSLVEVLPTLLERSLQRGWRAVVQAGSPERVAALDTLLWTYADESFLPHGTAGDGDAESQPIFLTQGETTPNGAAIRFMLDGASIGPILATEGHAYQRLMLLFDGRDDEAVAAARAQWSALKKTGATCRTGSKTRTGGGKSGAEPQRLARDRHRFPAIRHPARGCVQK